MLIHINKPEQRAVRLLLGFERLLWFAGREGSPVSNEISATSAFALSRIESQGWKAAKKLISAGESDVEMSDAVERNPYQTEGERSRWAAGFIKALESKDSLMPGVNSWRPPRSAR
jgi:hypothetical protein